LRPASYLSLENVVPFLARASQGIVTADSLKERAVLVLHVDEFHVAPDTAIEIMKAVQFFGYGNTKVLVVLTGLYTVEIPFLRRSVSGKTKIVPLGYFITREGGADLEKSWELVRNTVNA